MQKRIYGTRRLRFRLALACFFINLAIKRGRVNIQLFSEGIRKADSSSNFLSKRLGP